MPKKQPRNAYYFYMLDFKEEQRKKGIHYQNLAEVQVEADPSWRQLHPSVRSKYEGMAKAEKIKLRGSLDKKFTSNGVSLADIQAEQQFIMEMQEKENEEIKNFVSQNSIKNTLLEQDIYLIDVNAYCFAGTHYVMGEFAAQRFSVLDGVKKFYHDNINPGRIPIGYASDVKLGALELGLDMPEEDKPAMDHPKILAHLMDYLKQKSKGRLLPPLYTLPEKVEKVQDFIRQLCHNSGEDDRQLRVYKLDTLLFHMVNALKTCPEEGYPRSSLATTLLKKDTHKYTPGLACAHHEAGEKAMECSLSRVRRWAFTVLDKCCPVAGVEARPGYHVPDGVDIEGVLSYKELRREASSRAPSTVGAMSCSSSVVNDSEPEVNIWQKPKPQPKPHEPMRLPKADYSQAIRVPPELTEMNFPTLSGGRGRGMARNFNKMSLNK